MSIEKVLVIGFFDIIGFVKVRVVFGILYIVFLEVYYGLWIYLY